MNLQIKDIFSFGEKVKGYDVKVLNEREVRASAGILFMFALISFMNSWLVGDFTSTKIFVVAFMLDFFIRLFINPKFSPSLILGRFIVSKQKVEYIGASQKRFAWGIGFLLAVIMFYLVVLNDIIGPLNLFVCLSCLILLGFESFFGICIGCKVYNLFNKEKAKLCPGGTCENLKKEKIQRVGYIHLIILVLFTGFVIFISNSNLINNNAEGIIKNLTVEEMNEGVDNCKVPEWAIKIGHGDKWKLHHGCK